MAFTVTGLSSAGLTLVHCETIAYALEQAAKLVSHGYEPVSFSGAASETDGLTASFTRE